MEDKNQPQQTEKVAVSEEWTDKERLSVVRLVSLDLANTIDREDKNVLLSSIDLLTTGSSRILELNRANFEKYIESPSSD